MIELESYVPENGDWHNQSIYGVRNRNSHFGIDDNHNPRVSDICKKYVLDFYSMRNNNLGIRFHGNIGTGKSFYAACIANALASLGHTPIMTTIPNLVEELFKNSQSRLWEQAKSEEILIIDDFGVERASDYLLEKTFELIDARYQLTNSITLITTNLASSELNRTDDLRLERIYSRIKTICPMIINVVGEDHRKNEISEKQQFFKKLMDGEMNEN